MPATLGKKPMDSRFSYLFSSLQLLAGSSSKASSEESLPSLLFASALLIPLVGLLSLSSSRSCKHRIFVTAGDHFHSLDFSITVATLSSIFFSTFCLRSQCAQYFMNAREFMRSNRLLLVRCKCMTSFIRSSSSVVIC